MNVYETFVSFIDSGLRDRQMALFAYDDTTETLDYERRFLKEIKTNRLCLVHLNERNLPTAIADLATKVQELSGVIQNDYLALRVGVDFGGLTTSPHKVEIAIDLVSRLSNLSYPTTSVIGFQADSLPSNVVTALLRPNGGLMISSKNEHRISMFNYRFSETQSTSPIVETIPRRALERFVKKHLETIILSMMLESPECGYALIRKIYHRFHTFLSLSTIYPLLYSMRAIGLLTIVKSGTSRSKVYALTKQGKREAEVRVEEFLLAGKYLFESLRETCFVRAGASHSTPEFS